MTPHRIIALATVFVFALTSCEATKDARKKIDNEATGTDKTLAQLHDLPATPTHVITHQGQRAGDDSVPARRANRFPELQTQVDATTTKGQTLPIESVANIVYSKTHIPVLVEPDVADPDRYDPGQIPKDDDKSAGAPASDVGPDGAGAASIPDLGRAAAALAALAQGPGGKAQAARPSAGVGGVNTDLAYNYHGSAAGLLDEATTRLGLAWEVSESPRRFRIYRNVTRVFTVIALSSTSTANWSLDSGTDSAAPSSGATSGGTAGGAGATGSSGNASSTSGISATSKLHSEINSSLNSWDEINKTLPIVLGGRGAFRTAPGQGIVAVRGPAYLVDHDVADFIKSVNERDTRQVMIDVRVWRISNETDDNYGLDLNAVFQDLKGNLKLALTGPVNAITSDGGSGSLAILSSGSSPALRQFSDTQAIGQALSTLGDTRLVYRSAKLTVSNSVVPFQNVRNTGYLAQSGTQAAGLSTTSTALLIPGNITTGFNLFMLPKVLSNDQIMLQLGFSVSDLLALVTQSSGGQSIQSPNTDKQADIQTLYLKSGQWLVVAGDEQSQQSIDKSGYFDPAFCIIGCSHAATNTNSRIVVALRPIVWNAMSGNINRFDPSDL